MCYQKSPIFLHACASCSELPSNLSTMIKVFWSDPDTDPDLFGRSDTKIQFRFFLRAGSGFKLFFTFESESRQPQPGYMNLCNGLNAYDLAQGYYLN